MNDARTVFSAYVVHTCDYECVLAFLNLAERLELLVGPVLHVAALDLLCDFVLFARQHLISESLGYPKQVALVLSVLHEALDIIDVRTDCQSHVGSQRPRCCRPCEEVLVVMVDACPSELACKCVDLDVLVALRYLMRSESRSAARAVRQDLVSFVNKSLIEGGPDDPPSRLDIVVLVCDIRIFHVCQIGHLFRHVGPHLCVLEYRLTALLVEFLDAVLLDVLLAAESEFFLDLDLDRQAVGVPAAFALYLEALHGLISVDGVLECPCHHVVDARLSVGCRRSFVKHE